MPYCVKIYSWICRTLVIVMLEMCWKLRQISDFIVNNKSIEPEDKTKDDLAQLPSEIKPLTKGHKYKRHIRSMSDIVVTSSPHIYAKPPRPRRYSQHFILDDMHKLKRKSRSRHDLKNYDNSSSECDVLKKGYVVDKVIHCVDMDSMRYL